LRAAGIGTRITVEIELIETTAADVDRVSADDVCGDGRRSVRRCIRPDTAQQAR
jgi:hypothetical protein